MQHITNLFDRLALVHAQSVIHPFITAELVVSESDSAYTLPEPDAYARRLAEQAEAWLRHARERSRMKDAPLVSKTLGSLAFSFRHRANDLAVPSKLSGTSKHQPALWQLTRSRIPFGTPLDVEEVWDGKRVRLVVSFEGDVLGEVQGKHVPWLCPLVPFGAGVFLTRVTGHQESYTLGCNVAFGRVGHAVEALNHALGTDVGGDGYGGGAPQANVDAGGDGPLPAVGGAAPGGDGAAGHLRLVSSALPVANPQGDTTHIGSADPDDVVLYRDMNGTARCSRQGQLLEHAVRHSPSGVEWGYHGSGPADLARSVLLAFTDEATAEALYQAFKAEVIAAGPRAGGVIRAVDVRAWLAAQDAK